MKVAEASAELAAHYTGSGLPADAQPGLRSQKGLRATREHSSFAAVVLSGRSASQMG